MVSGIFSSNVILIARDDHVSHLHQPSTGHFRSEPASFLGLFRIRRSHLAQAQNPAVAVETCKKMHLWDSLCGLTTIPGAYGDVYSLQLNGFKNKVPAPIATLGNLKHGFISHLSKILRFASFPQVPTYVQQRDSLVLTGRRGCFFKPLEFCISNSKFILFK